MIIVMSRTLVVPIVALVVAAAALSSFRGGPAAASENSAVLSPLPAPTLDDPRSATPARESVVVAGGCFWGVQAVFQHVAGVLSATSGYAGGKQSTASYHLVSTGATGHAESVSIAY